MSSETTDGRWGRGRLLLLVAGVAAAAVAAVVGVLLALHASLDAQVDEAPTRESGKTIPANDEVALPGPLSSRVFPVIEVPAPTRVGPVGVPSGFPRTAAGALAQLGALDQHVLQSASVTVAQEVITAWAVPGGPTAETWSGVHAVAAMLSSAGRDAASEADPLGGLVVTAVPSMGMIEDGEGAGEPIVCVNFVLTATLTSTATVAATDCQRMVWNGRRWMIAAGAEPQQAPSVWPGTDAAYVAGYALWRDEVLR